MKNNTTHAYPVPKIDPSAFIAKGAVVMGDVTLKANSSVWYNAVLRCIDEPIVIGEGSNIQDNTVIHVDEGCPVIIGQNVTVGHSSIIHGCNIGDNSLIGMGSIIMNGAVIGSNCIIGAGALVTQNTIIPDNSLVLGSPAKVVRQLSKEDVAGNAASAHHYILDAKAFREMEE